jgi:hypothetical protein
MKVLVREIALLRTRGWWAGQLPAMQRGEYSANPESPISNPGH